MVQPENYFVLDPREATVMDLMRLLLYSDLENRKFVDTSVENLENRLCEIGGRWIIFVSIVVQKLLIILRKPLSFLGFALGFWLNLPSSNGGFFKIFLNLVRDFDQTRSTEVIVIRDTKENSNLIIVSFRGTDPFNADDWCTDLDLSWHDVMNVGKIHGGFMKALGLPKEGCLGGALAILFTAVLMMHDEKKMLERLEGVYTFGQPRLKEFDVKYKRYVYCNDMVPRLPFDDKTLMFKHFGDCLYCNSFYKGKVEEEEPNKNYFNIFWVIPKILNAVWELIRSFIISCWQGKEYREGWLLTCFRLVALLIPGLPAHFPNEYVNVALLGNFPPHVPDSQNLHADDLNVSLLRN
ncbi:lipase class 3 family protein [Arabidopsis lyrata subsp. lyrata]|uniref:Lipase class 3 family protein n=1 Tax=Arabidopsis lyrata subsp. lyrata TaxID=81972 RepID=D7KC39_ARALL|nr:lipase class 3 family protein [Arabidopsis lyrata subsp. lyrata]